MEILPSECIGITGSSGSGKSLLLRAIADMDEHGGAVFLDGKEKNEMPAHEWRKKVGLLPAESAWWFDTVGEHFSTIDHNAMDSLGFTPEVLKWDVSRLSSGEKQRLALLRLLQNQPKALLLDEPTANLDARNIEKVESFLTTYRIENSIPAIWISHDMDQLGRMSTRRMTISANQLVPV